MSDANTHVDGRKALCKSVFSIIRFVLNERPKLLAFLPKKRWRATVTSSGTEFVPSRSRPLGLVFTLRTSPSSSELTQPPVG